MNKTKLGIKLAEKFGFNKAKGLALVEFLTDTIIEELKKGGEVTLTGFGSFSTRERKGRPGVNPRTKERIRIPTVRVPKFKAGKNLKRVLRQP